MAAAAVGGLGVRGLRIVSDPVVGPARRMVGKVGMTALSWGAPDRAAITRFPDAIEVRLVSRPISLSDLLRRISAPTLFHPTAAERRQTDRELPEAFPR